MLHIDGTYGEGGGQIVRTALALSVLTGQAFELSNIRAGRSQPGLKAQHLSAIEAWRQIGGAQTNEVRTGSSFLKFHPGSVQAGRYQIDIGTAGSIALLLQALLLPLSFGRKPTQLLLTGGTAGRWQAPVEFYQLVLLPYLQRLASLDLERLRLGYYPKGGGKVRLRIEPLFDHVEQLSRAVPPFDLRTPGTVLEIHGIAHAAAFLQKAQVAERQAAAARQALQSIDCPQHITVEYSDTRSPGSGITLCAIMENRAEGGVPFRVGGSALGERGKPAEKVGKAAAQRLLSNITTGAPVDEYLSDQLIPFLALLPGSRMQVARISDHLLSNIYVVEQFLPVRFHTEGSLVSTARR